MKEESGKNQFPKPAKTSLHSFLEYKKANHHVVFANRENEKYAHNDKYDFVNLLLRQLFSEYSLHFSLFLEN